MRCTKCSAFVLATAEVKQILEKVACPVSGADGVQVIHYLSTIATVIYMTSALPDGGIYKVCLSKLLLFHLYRWCFLPACQQNPTKK